MKKDIRYAFLDTNFFIYLLDSNASLANSAESIFKQLQQDNISFLTSSITIMEYLVLPNRHDDYQAIANFYSFLVDAGIEVIPITSNIASLAAQIRSENLTLRQMDALQVAVASSQNCQYFVTNDKNLKLTDQLSRIPITD